MTPYPLHRSERQTKILITLFLLSMIAAFGVAGLNIYDKVGRMKSGVAHRYGSEPQPTAAITQELPPENSPEAVAVPPDDLAARLNTFGSLVDLTHPHLFQIPLMLFVLAHFLMRTRVSEWLKLANYLAAFGGMIAFIAAPWVVRYVSVGWAWLLYAGASAMGVTVFVMVIVPIWDMWRPPQPNAREIRRETAMASGE